MVTKEEIAERLGVDVDEVPDGATYWRMDANITDNDRKRIKELFGSTVKEG